MLPTAGPRPARTPLPLPQRGGTAVDPTAPTRTAPPDVPRSAPRGFVLRLGLANLGLYSALLTPVVVTMALRVAEVAPQHKESTLGLVLGVGAVLAMIANPLFGRLSDRTRSRFGRRRPWLVGTAAVAALLGALLVTRIKGTR
ncbi:hypothetical protein F1721_20590 [Saccharopolyspora hirsuta]|uniref:MFS transporter n=1 Tax=Saccharopolyspora hirsuta TaxID=1837 RepID=A0A5M7BSJ0_SACHI|nr:hypothetical protein F1721_20590 [Saccharopolyspora hirsuta]